MAGYLQYKFEDTPQQVSAFDEMPLWSASFGLLLLKHIELKRDAVLLDVGSGTGFPLFELAGRLGPSSMCYGLDVWVNANNRAREKAHNYNVSNVTIIDGSAGEMPFSNGYFDVIVSNLGINNFTDPGLVMDECFRVLKSNGKLAITTNLDGHWTVFYNIFEQTLRQLGKPGLIEKLNESQRHRGTMASVEQLFTDNGFKINRLVEDQLEMKFLDGTAFLNHHFIKLGWLADWKSLVPEDEQPAVFNLLETNLNEYAKRNGTLTLTVPMLYAEGVK